MMDRVWRLLAPPIANTFDFIPGSIDSDIIKGSADVDQAPGSGSRTSTSKLPSSAKRLLSRCTSFVSSMGAWSGRYENLLDVWLADDIEGRVPDAASVVFGSLYACELDELDDPNKVEYRSLFMRMPSAPHLEESLHRFRFAQASRAFPSIALLLVVVKWVSSLQFVIEMARHGSEVVSVASGVPLTRQIKDWHYVLFFMRVMYALLLSTQVKRLINLMLHLESSMRLYPVNETFRPARLGMVLGLSVFLTIETLDMYCCVLLWGRRRLVMMSSYFVLSLIGVRRIPLRWPPLTDGSICCPPRSSCSSGTSSCWCCSLGLRLCCPPPAPIFLLCSSRM